LGPKKKLKIIKIIKIIILSCRRSLGTRQIAKTMEKGKRQWA
jgi:hypothetical protein